MSDTTEETPHHDPQPGILFVTSDTLSPDILPHDTFNSWYITTHVPLVLSTAGKQITTATRYSHIPYSSTRPSHPLDPSISTPRLSLLTIYSLTDTSFTTTPEFRSLGSEYTGPYLDAVFSNAEFDARCYESHSPSQAQAQPPPDPGSILLCAMMSDPPPPPPPESESESDGKGDERGPWTMEQWFHDEHIPFFHTVTGYKRSALYNFRSRHLLSRAEPSSPRSAEWMIIHEFEGMRIPGIGFRDVESEMGRVREEVLLGGKEEGRGKKGNGKREMEFSFWALTGQYWRKG